METNTSHTVDFTSVLRGRHAVRKYDPHYKISDEELKEMLTEATRAPSSANIQPWRFLVVTDPALKEKLLPVAFNQEQILTSSAVIAVLTDLEGYKEADKIYDQAVSEGYMTTEVKNQLVTNLKNYYANSTPEKNRSSFLIDAGLVSMQIMLVAKAHGYDTSPMAGYDPQKLKALFDIPDRYTDVMLIAIGKASEPAHPTVRLPLEDVAFWNGFSN